MADRVPGIIVRIVDDTGTIVPPIFERYPTYIGVGDPYRLVSDTEVVRSAGVVDNIPHMNTINSIIGVGDLPGIVNYTAGADYVQVGDQISWNFPGGDKPTLGDTYFITFTETRAASAYDPMLYFDENLIFADHGNKIRNKGDINDVSKAGSLGLNNASNGVIIAQLDPTAWVDAELPTNAELETSFTNMVSKLNSITDYKLLLVPLSSGTLNTTTAADIMFNHAVIASQPDRKQERSVLASMPIGTTYGQFATYAQSYAHERMTVPAVYDGRTRISEFTTDYDMRFYTAALAGKLCSVGIGDTISDEIIAGVKITGNFTPPEQKFLVQRGVSPAKSSGDVVRNVFAITTNTTSALTEDLGVQDIKDYTKKYWREGLWNVYKNKPVRTVLTEGPGASKGILRDLVDRVILDDYKDIVIAQNSTEPRKVNVSAKCKPAYRTQWFDITFTFVLSF